MVHFVRRHCSASVDASSQPAASAIFLPTSTWAAPFALAPMALAALVLGGCPERPDGPTDAGEPEAADAGPSEPDAVVFGESLGLSACDTETVTAYPDHRCYTYRAVAGVSMGGGTSARMGFGHPELFDVVGIMGTPFADNRFFWGMLEEGFLGGFCPLEQLEAAMAIDPASLNDPTNPEIFCGIHDEWPLPETGPALEGVFPAVEGSECWLFQSDFNHWYRGPDAGRGGRFTRNSLIEVFHDLIAANGNPLTYNPDSNYFPPGVPETWRVAPRSGTDPATLCAEPIVLSGVYNREYNPEGTYDVITYCDGASGRTGAYDPQDPEARAHAIEFALAVDLNGNGLRDYGEPIVINNRERFRDVGLDGVASIDEPGYDPQTNPDPAGDDWDPMLNPDGAERNYVHDEGEPYDDDGLDGVPGTGDLGEGNGAYDISPTLQKWYEKSPADLFAATDDVQAARLDVWMDAGIRDFLNTAQISNSLYATLARRMDAKVFNDFPSLPGLPEGESYAYFNADYSREEMGQLTYLRYGDPEICPDTDNTVGDGNHVGPDVVNRLYTLFSFMSARMPPEGRDRGFGGDLGDLESPTGAITDFGFMSAYDSSVLGKEVPYGVLLPPDYFLSDAVEEDRRYPVLYFFHGQGMSAQDLVTVGLALWGSMKESVNTQRALEGKTDLQRAIIIWVDGECHDDECFTGNFYTDFEGLPRDDRRFETAFYELARHVDATYRTKGPRLVPNSEVPR